MYILIALVVHLVLSYGGENLRPAWMTKISEYGFGIGSTGSYNTLAYCTIGTDYSSSGCRTAVEGESGRYPGARIFQSVIHEGDSDGFHIYGGFGYDQENSYGTLGDLWWYDFELEEWYFRWGYNTHTGENDGLSMHNFNKAEGAQSYDCSLIPDETENKWCYQYKTGQKIGARHGAAIWYANNDENDVVDLDTLMFFGGVGYNCLTKQRYVNNEVWRQDVRSASEGILYTHKDIWAASTYALSPVSPRFNSTGADFLSARAFLNPHKPGWVDEYTTVLFGGYYDPRTCLSDVWELFWNVVTTGNDPMPVEWTPVRGYEESLVACQSEVWNDSLPAGDQHPESRYGYLSWEYNNDIYFFGGTNNCIGVYLGDIWTLDSSYEWAKISEGTSKYQSPAIYDQDSPGMFDVDNYIGNRMQGAFFQFYSDDEVSQYFAFFGGFGFAKDGAGFLNDLWLYRVDDGKWAYMTPFINVNDGGSQNESATVWSSGRYGMTGVDRGDGRLLFMMGQTYRDKQIELIGDLWELSFEPGDLFECDGETSLSLTQCNARGLCYIAEDCICSEYYDGNLCQNEKYTCDGIIYSKAEVCSSVGECIDFDNCVCGDDVSNDIQFFGQFCEEYYGKRAESIQPSNTSQTVLINIPLVTKQEFISEKAGEDFWEMHEHFNCSLAIQNFEILGNVSSCSWLVSSQAATEENKTDILVVNTTRYWAHFEYEQKDEWGNYPETHDVNNLYVYAQGNANLNETAYIRVYWFLGNVTEEEDPDPDIVEDDEDDVVDDTSASTGGGEYALIGGGLVLLLCFVIVALVMCCCCCCFVCLCWCSCIPLTITLYKASQLNHIKLLELEQEMHKGEDVENILYGKDLFNINWDDLDLAKIISQGSTATIFRAKHKGKTCAVKCFRTKDIATQDHMDDFEKEVKLLRQLQHPHILVYFGASRKPPRMGIVEEYCPNGDLRYAVQEGFQKNFKTKMDLGTKLRILKEVCCAMAHLNSMSIIHRDLKSDNILMTKDFTAKLIDFGLSRVMEGATTMYLTKQAGTSQYMAPEVTLSSQYGEKCDVYSFGVMLFEVLTENFTPYFIDGMPPEFNVELRVALNPDFRPLIDNYPQGLAPALDWYCTLMKLCWDVNVDKRPDFALLEKIIERHTEACLASWLANEGKQREIVLMCAMGDLLQTEAKEAVEQHQFDKVELDWSPEEKGGAEKEGEEEGEVDMDEMFDNIDFDEY